MTLEHVLFARLFLYGIISVMLLLLASMCQSRGRKVRNGILAIYFAGLAAALSGRIFFEIQMQSFIADWFLTPIVVVYAIVLAVDLFHATRGTIRGNYGRR